MGQVGTRIGWQWLPRRKQPAAVEVPDDWAEQSAWDEDAKWRHAFGRLRTAVMIHVSESSVAETIGHEDLRALIGRINRDLYGGGGE
jgi:hypothetical protein